VRKACRRVDVVECCMSMETMRPVEIFTVMGGREIKVNDERIEFNYDIFDIL
jgi:hypothetical protein